MQINRYRDIRQGKVLEDIAEGRMVIVADSGEEGLWGLKLPTSAAEALRATYCVAWPPTNQLGPYYNPIPSMSYALRGGFDQTANTPFDAEVSFTYKGDYENSTIPSGTLTRVFTDGAVITVTSGQFVDSVNLIPGNPLGVAYSGDNKGKLQYDASGTVAVVEYYDSDELRLTFRINGL